MATYQKPSFETFAAYAKLAGIENTKMLRDIYNAAGAYFADQVDPGDILDLMATSDTAPDSYKQYLANFEAVKQAQPLITTVKQWNEARKEYRTVLKNFQLDDLATNENADKFLSGGVSAVEAYDRVKYAYDSILNADDQLKAQLKQYFPNLEPKELVKTVLGVGRTVEELQKDVERAGIQAGAVQAGLTATNVDALQRAGVSREQAAAGFSNIKQGLQSVGAAAARAGTSVEGLQQELESEQFLGMASQRRKKLAAREQAALTGQSGTMTGSLSRQISGSF